MAHRSPTPIFNALVQRYNEPRDGETPRLASWADRAWMRGTLYGIVLQGVLAQRRPRPRFTEPWHHPSPWDAIDHTPSEHDPSL